MNNSELKKRVPATHVLVVQHFTTATDLGRFAIGKKSPRYATRACLHPRKALVLVDGKPDFAQSPYTHVAYAVCSPKDTPNRKLGYAIAVGRVLRDYLEDATVGFDDGEGCTCLGCSCDNGGPAARL